MRFIRKSAFAIFLLIVLFGGIWRIFAPNEEKESEYSKFPELVSENNPKLSPSGKYLLGISRLEVDGIRYHAFWVKDAKTDEIVFEGDMFLRRRDTNYVLWGESDRIWIYNGDTGIYYWEYMGNAWDMKSHALDGANMKAPEALVQLRPRFFEQ